MPDDREDINLAERSLELDSIELAAAIFGSGDQNIHLLEKEFRVTAVCRGSVLRFTGEQRDVDAAARAVDGMVTLMENHTPLEEQTVRYCISLAHGGEEKRLRELTDDFVAVTAKGRPIHPKTLGQKEYLAAIRKNAITFGVGPAGTGKTYLAVAMAVKAFKSKDVSRIILTRPAVEAGEKLGFLPATCKIRWTPICVRSMMVCSICWVQKPFKSCLKSRLLRSRRWPICAGERWTMPSSFWTRHRTQRPSR